MSEMNQDSLGFLVCKIAKNNVSIVIDGAHRKLPRQSEQAKEVIELVKEYNSTGDVQARTDLKNKITELVTPAIRIASATDGRFEFDGNSKMYLKGTKDPIPDILAKKLMQFLRDELPLDALVNFWKHLLLNPDPAVREQLYLSLIHI